MAGQARDRAGVVLGAAGRSEPMPAARAGIAARLRQHVERLAGGIGERHVWCPSALQAAARYIRDQLESQGHRVVLQGYTVQGVLCENLEVAIEGRSGAGGIILAGAHYDTVPGSPGANDNASGIAGLIEMARALRDCSPARSIRLVAFVNEESPFFYSDEMGSAIYARAARRNREDIRVMLSLEMLGYYSESPGSQHYPPFLRLWYPDRANFIAFVSNLRSRRALREVVSAFRAHSDFPSESLASPAVVPGVSWSDQLSFWREGYPGVMVTDTAFYRYRHYHSPLDTPDKLCYEQMANVVSGLTGTVASLAGIA